MAQQPATVTDLPTLVSSLLTTFGSVPHTTATTVTTTVCLPHMLGQANPVCNTVQHAGPPQTVQQVMTATNLRMITGQPTFGQPTQTAFPDQMTAWDIEQINCGDGSATATVNFSTTVQHSSTVGLTQSLTSSTQFSVSFSTGSLAGVGGPSVTAGMSFGNSATNATATTDLTSLSDARGAQAGYTLPTKGAIVGMFEVWPINFSLPFSMTVTVDGDLSPNDKNYATLAQIFTPAQRTVSVTGIIQVTEASQGQVVWYTPPDFNVVTTCAGQTGIVKIPYTPPAGAKINATGTNVLAN